MKHIFSLLLAVVTMTTLVPQKTNGQVTTAQQPLLMTHVETGDVQGVLDGTDLAVYRAIPYAAPPVGDLRWKEVVGGRQGVRHVRSVASTAYTS